MAVRRLPVVQNDEQTPRRPAWHWVLIGSGFAVTLWLPLLALALWLGPRTAIALGLEDPRWTIAAALLMAYGVASLLAGLWVRRFGRVDWRHAALGPVVGSLGILSLALLGGGNRVSVVLLAISALAVVGGLGGALGGRLGRR